MAEAMGQAVEALKWRSWPLRDEPWRKSLLLLLLIAITVAIAAMITPSAAPLAALLLFILLGPYFLPTHFIVSGAGVEKRFPLFNRRRGWEQYKRHLILKDGIFLGTFPYPSRLDSFRGDFLRYGPGADPQELIALVRRHLVATAPAEL